MKFVAHHDGYGRILRDGDLDSNANPFPYSFAPFRWILCFMQDENMEHESALKSGVEFLKGCPACEHSDPELERELQAFAQLLFDIYLADREEERQRGRRVEIDNIP